MLFATGCPPQALRIQGVPSWSVHAIGHVPDRYLHQRPAWEQVGKYVPADIAVQATHGVNRATAADCQACHVKRLLLVGGISAAQREKLIRRDARQTLREQALEVAGYQS